MDKEEASQLLAEVMKQFRAMSYEDLAGLIHEAQVFERVAHSGNEYQVEVQAFWDEPRRPEGNLRVLASIDDGRFPAAFIPLTTDFIMRPDGTFEGE